MKATTGYDTALWLKISSQGHAPLLLLEWVRRQSQVWFEAYDGDGDEEPGTITFRFGTPGQRTKLAMQECCDYINANLSTDETEEGTPLENITFFWKDKTGRGFSETISLKAIMDGDDDINYDGDSLHEWATNAEKGDTWENGSSIYTCTQDS